MALVLYIYIYIYIGEGNYEVKREIYRRRKLTIYFLFRSAKGRVPKQEAVCLLRRSHKPVRVLSLSKNVKMQDVFQAHDHRKLNKKGALSSIIPGDRQRNQLIRNYKTYLYITPIVFFFSIHFS